MSTGPGPVRREKNSPALAGISLHQAIEQSGHSESTVQGHSDASKLRQHADHKPINSAPGSRIARHSRLVHVSTDHMAKSHGSGGSRIEESSEKQGHAHDGDVLKEVPV